jgi:hypothetical protein
LSRERTPITPGASNGKLLVVADTPESSVSDLDHLTAVFADRMAMAALVGGQPLCVPSGFTGGNYLGGHTTGHRKPKGYSRSRVNP